MSEWGRGGDEAGSGAAQSPRDTSSQKDDRSGSVGNTALLGFVYGVPLLVRLGFTYLGMKRRAKKAGKIFKKELLAAGVDPRFADELTGDYMRTSHLFSEIMKSAGRSRAGHGG